MSAEISELTDHQLLSRYVKDRDGVSFSVVVNRYIDLVYTAALRQVRHSHQAEDVTQAVFLILSQRASSITSHIVLPGWLLITTRNVSRNAQVSERRLKDREKKAATMKPVETDSILADSEAISPILDEALANLTEEDRNAIVYRFFQAKSHREVGEALGVSEDAASQRVLRALDKLKSFMARQGVTTSQAALSAALPLIAVKSAPPALAAVVSGGFAGVSSSVAAIAKPVLGGKTVSAALIGWGSAAAVAIAVTAGVVLMQNTKNPPAIVTSQPAIAPVVNNNPPAPPVVATQLTVTVIDPLTKAPVTDAELQYSQGGRQQQWIKVDQNGKAAFPLPNLNQSVQINARAPGRVQSRIIYNSTPIRGDQPGEMHFALDRGIVIGGTVVDGDGNPIPEARVQFGLYNSQGGSEPEPTFVDIEIVTDAEGRWTFEQAPKELSRLAIYATHPTIANSSSSLKGNSEDLKTEQAKIVVTKSNRDVYTRSGDVVDEAGKPVSGAKVMWYYSRYQSEKPTATTDDQGQFTITSKQSESDPMMVVAKGYGPEVINRQLIMERKEIHVIMRKPRSVEGTLLDPAGNPIKGAAVELAQIGSNGESLEWNTRTDENGHFVWADAPQEEFRISISLKNRSRLYQIPVPFKSGPLNLIMYPQTEIVGTVIDSETHQPIPSFTMDYGVRWTGQEDVTWQTQNNRPIANGKFAATMTEFSNGGKLRVTADGYLPAVSRLIEAKEGVNGNVTVNFELTRGKGANGTILAADGKPVADVDVILFPVNSGFSINLDDPARNMRGYSGTAFTKTDAQGHFQFQPIEGEHRLIVSCNEGFTIVNSIENGSSKEIKLDQWAKVEGTVRANAGPGAGIEMYANLSREFNEDRIYFNSNTVTADNEGHFTFNRLPPGSIRIGRAHRFNKGSSTAFLDGRTVELKAGEKTSLTFGGTGRPVVGKITIPVDIKTRTAMGSNTFAIPATSQNKSTFNPYDVVEFPEDYPDWSSDKRRKWQDEMLKKPKLRAMMKAMADNQNATTINLLLKDDGSFRADDVAPGNYVFDLDLREPWRQNQTRPSESLGVIHGEFIVPEKPACPTNEVLDIGEFTLKQTAARFAVGSDLPRIQLMHVDGKPFDYNAYRGKTMIFHVWRLDGNETSKESLELEQKYKGNDQVVLVHVGIETLAPWARRVAEREKWEALNVIGKAEFHKQYDPGEWVPWACNFNSPAYMIIDGNGKLTGYTSKPGDVEAIVAKSLGK